MATNTRSRSLEVSDKNPAPLPLWFLNSRGEPDEPDVSLPPRHHLQQANVSVRGVDRVSHAVAQEHHRSSLRVSVRLRSCRSHIQEERYDQVWSRPAGDPPRGCEA